MVVATTNPSTIQNSSNTSNQLATKKSKSGAEQNLVIATMRAIDDMNDMDDVASIDEGRIWKIGLDDIVEY
jgi:transaldolase